MFMCCYCGGQVGYYDTAHRTEQECIRHISKHIVALERQLSEVKYSPGRSGTRPVSTDCGQMSGSVAPVSAGENPAPGPIDAGRCDLFDGQEHDHDACGACYDRLHRRVAELEQELSDSRVAADKRLRAEINNNVDACNELAWFKAKWVAACDKMQVICQANKLGLGGDDVFDLVVKEHARLKYQLEDVCRVRNISLADDTALIRSMQNELAEAKGLREQALVAMRQEYERAERAERQNKTPKKCAHGKDCLCRDCPDCQPAISIEPSGPIDATEVAFNFWKLKQERDELLEYTAKLVKAARRQFLGPDMKLVFDDILPAVAAKLEGK